MANKTTIKTGDLLSVSFALNESETAQKPFTARVKNVIRRRGVCVFVELETPLNNPAMDAAVSALEESWNK